MDAGQPHKNVVHSHLCWTGEANKTVGLYRGDDPNYQNTTSNLNKPPYPRMTNTTVALATFLLLLVICKANEGKETVAHEKPHDLEQVLSEIEVNDPEMDTECTEGDDGHITCHTKGKNWSNLVRKVHHHRQHEISVRHRCLLPQRVEVERPHTTEVYSQLSMSMTLRLRVEATVQEGPLAPTQISQNLKFLRTFKVYQESGWKQPPHNDEPLVTTRTDWLSKTAQFNAAENSLTVHDSFRPSRDSSRRHSTEFLSTIYP
ncbi:hypothetical protein CLF_107041 [Clonorchis sinensis]|uniref:Uncharacterized protein n=1 Tax=Clonorchis sinensis TaxID=79923 RepID=G7YQC8_CLOSI|nr:hypothetical protein CLF_107041 [Clonorchis sinensis]